MSKFSLLTQCILIVIAVSIGMLYIKPTIEKIGVIEDNTALYREELKKVSDVNQTLDEKLSIIDSVTPADKDNLLRYLPDTIDDIAVMKDIVAIFNQVSVDVTGVVYAPGETINHDQEGELFVKGVDAHNFTVVATLNYDQLMSALRAIEVNNYLLQVSSLKMAPDELGQLKATLVLTAFTKQPRPETAPAVIE
jgi:hypothetical protein